MRKAPWVLKFKYQVSLGFELWVKDFTSAVFTEVSAKRFCTEQEARQYRENHEDHLWAFDPHYSPENGD
jgi:hypothetical protein